LPSFFGYLFLFMGAMLGIGLLLLAVAGVEGGLD
jgi:hypothetical protein